MTHPYHVFPRIKSAVLSRLTAAGNGSLTADHDEFRAGIDSFNREEAHAVEVATSFFTKRRGAIA